MTGSGINWGYIWGSIGVRGNDAAAAKDWTENVLVPAAEQAASQAAPALLMMIPGLEEFGVEDEAAMFAADATRIERPVYTPEPVVENPGATRIQQPNAATAESNASGATQEPKVTKVGKTSTGETRVHATQGEKRLDITHKRVKEYAPEPKNPNTGERKINFDKEGLPKDSKVVPGSKGYKRTPTPDEKKLLDSHTDKPSN